LKLKQWQIIKDEGLLKKLATTQLEDDEELTEFEIQADRILRQKGSKLLLRQPKSTDDENDDDEEDDNTSQLTSEFHKLEAKFILAKNDEIKLYNLLLEINDKKLVEIAEELIEKILDSFSKLSLTSKRWHSLLELCFTWYEEEVLSFNSQFWSKWLRKLAVNPSINSYEEILQPMITKLVENYLLEEEDIVMIETLFLLRQYTSLHNSLLTPPVPTATSGGGVTASSTTDSKAKFSPKSILSRKKKGSTSLTSTTTSNTIIPALSTPNTNTITTTLNTTQLHVLSQQLEQQLQTKIYSQLFIFPISAINDLIRTLGTFGYLEEMLYCFHLLQTISHKYTQLRPNLETMEFLVNGLILSGQIQENTAKMMKELPTNELNIPEIILLGRSNVGKSSLVNLLLNRKNLASVSATPGHTQAFHFFTCTRRSYFSPHSRLTSNNPINNNSVNCITEVTDDNSMDSADDINTSNITPPTTTITATNIMNSLYRRGEQIRLVDVPGLGYAETVDANQQQSWKSLLMRYLTVRASCQTVLHLIDSRHAITSTDQEVSQ
jgi:GTP-binding protein EngB required for normal cell division